MYGELLDLARHPDPQTMLRAWDALKRSATGRWLFNRALAVAIPYSGGVGARVIRLEPGGCTVTLEERRAVRNHLRSVHAIALANIAELASGLAMSTQLPPGARGIVTRIEIDYLRKARGQLTARSAVPPFPHPLPLEYQPTADVTDTSGAVVARACVTWRLQTTPGAPQSPSTGAPTSTHTT